MDIARSALADRLTAAATDEASIAAREGLCVSLGAAFRSASKTLWTYGAIFGVDRKAGKSPFNFGSDATVSAAWIAGIAGELVTGGVSLLRDGNRYAAMALVRQLVEVEYIAWAIAEDTDQAEAWIRSTKDERLRMWQPRHIRARSQGRFRATDYGTHCEHGGHPTPEGRLLLPEHSAPMYQIGVCWYELTVHAHSAWRYFSATAAAFDDTDYMANVVSQAASAANLSQTFDRWDANEQLYEVNAAIQREAQRRPHQMVRLMLVEPH